MKLIFPRSVFAADPLPKPTPQYVEYLRSAQLITFLGLFFVMVLINNFLFCLLFRFLKIKFDLKRLLIFTVLMTLVSFVAYGLWYWAALPNTGWQQLNYSAPQGQSLLNLGGFRGYWVVLWVLFFNPLSWLGFLVTFLASYFLIKRLALSERFIKRVSLLVSLVLFPLIGVFLASFLTNLYFSLFPFVGQRWLPFR